MYIAHDIQRPDLIGKPGAKHCGGGYKPVSTLPQMSAELLALNAVIVATKSPFETKRHAIRRYMSI